MLKNTYIKLSDHEIQSGSSRVKWAEGLIEQLPATHEGRNSWLLNYGIGSVACAMKINRAKSDIASNRKPSGWDVDTQSLETRNNTTNEKAEEDMSKNKNFKIERNKVVPPQKYVRDLAIGDVFEREGSLHMRVQPATDMRQKEWSDGVFISNINTGAVWQVNGTEQYIEVNCVMSYTVAV